MLFDNNDINFDLAFMNISNLSDNNLIKNNEAKTQNLYSIKDGFLRGNMFKDEYKPYKNYKFSLLSPKSEKEAKLYNLIAYSFAINDLNLYLDLNPEDKEMVRFLKELIKEEKVLKEEYSKHYEPLTIDETEKNEFAWSLTNFPWNDFGGSQYV